MPIDDLSRVGLGTHSDDDRDQWRENVRAALDAGYRHVDTAQDYDNEQYVGAGVRDADVDRADIFLATKVSTANLAARDLELDDEDLERIDAIDRRERVIDPSWAPWNR